MQDAASPVVAVTQARAPGSSPVRAVAPGRAGPVARVAALGACVAALAGGGAAAAALRPPLTLEQLARRDDVATLSPVRALRSAPGHTAYLATYRSDGLRLQTLVAVPDGPPPAGGFPVLVACHGTHPDPPRYGYTAAGADERPGDYYREIPAAYAAAGFLVVMPDYRGHNDSEGAPFARGALAPAYFAQDVRDLLSALPSLPQADARNVFLWGHSLGGEVALRVLLALAGLRGVQVRAASLWATVDWGAWEQADDDGPRAADAASPLERLATPLVLHHGTGDLSARFEASQRLAAALERLRRPPRFFVYPTAEHFLDATGRRQAVARDVEFFRAHLAGAPAP
jgi:dipeptidyl aminopeptidase/acylaminoacyl peptidase